MDHRFCLLAALATLLLAGYAYPSTTLVGSATIHAPAVLLQTNQGALTTIMLNVTAGNGHVAVIGPEIVGNSTIGSAQEAAIYASSYLGVDFNSYNFTYAIENNTTSVSGPSAGAAMTLLAVSALSHRPLRQDFTITGTINSTGGIGEIGGVYDKVSAAKRGGMDFVMVPAVPSASSEDELYYLVQNEFSMPLVQVANISEAAQYAFNSSRNPYADETYYNFYTNYSVSSLPAAPLACSNSCNDSTFVNLTLFTFNITAQRINKLAESSNFANVSRQMLAVLDQSRAIAADGYLYTGADFSFLDYVNAFYFDHHTTNITAGMSTLQHIMSVCAALSPPQLTSSNYEYVLGGELRQAWANFTVNSTIALYNFTAIDTDGVLNALYNGGEAQGWCSAASFLYNASAAMQGVPVVLSPALKAVAASRLARASHYPGLYLSTAASAYDSGNYALAILDADYAYALSTPTGSMPTQLLLSSAEALSANATFGVWATQYANEARFYIREADIAANATLARNYAAQAYSVAELASQVSNDTSLIAGSMKQITQVTSPQVESSLSGIEAEVALLRNELYTVAIIEVAEIAAFAVIIILVVLQLNKQKAQAERAERRARGRRRRS
ncbi:MAG: S16 family serine protease [Candidatus Micrarchaeia archaeon]